MNTQTTRSAPVSGLLSLVEALEHTDSATQTSDLPTGLGRLAGAWMVVKGDGHGWMLLQFSPCAESADADPLTAVDSPRLEAHQVPARPDFGARATRVHTALTDREREVLCLVAGGATNQVIGRRLFISPRTASVHVSRILAKLNATTRTEAAALAHASGLIRPWGTVEAATQPESPPSRPGDLGDRALLG